MKLNTTAKVEFIWLGSIALLTILLVQLFLGWGNWGLDIQIRESYITLTVGQIFFLLFLNIVFAVYAVKQFSSQFQNTLGNLILIVSSGLLIYVTSITVKFTGSLDQGWTIYPTFSSSPIALNEKFKITSSVNMYIQFYEIVQILVLAMTGIMTGYRWRK